MFHIICVLMLLSYVIILIEQSFTLSYVIILIEQSFTIPHVLSEMLGSISDTLFDYFL